MKPNEPHFRRWGEKMAPCKDCPDRCVGCHGQDANGLYKCERYGAFKTQQDAEYAARKEFLRQNDEVAEVLWKRRYGRQ